MVKGYIVKFSVLARYNTWSSKNVNKSYHPAGHHAPTVIGVKCKLSSDSGSQFQDEHNGISAHL